MKRSTKTSKSENVIIGNNLINDVRRDACRDVEALIMAVTDDDDDRVIAKRLLTFLSIVKNHQDQKDYLEFAIAHAFSLTAEFESARDNFVNEMIHTHQMKMNEMSTNYQN